jgi:hypothetical protein
MLNHWMYFPASHAFSRRCAVESTRQCISLAECTGLLPSLIADAYLMGGEL